VPTAPLSTVARARQDLLARGHRARRPSWRSRRRSAVEHRDARADVTRDLRQRPNARHSRARGSSSRPRACIEQMRRREAVALQAPALRLGYGSTGTAGMREIFGERLGVEAHDEARGVGHGYPSSSAGRSPNAYANSSSVIGRPPTRRRIASNEVSGRSSRLPSALRSSSTDEPRSPAR